MKSKETKYGENRRWWFGVVKRKKCGSKAANSMRCNGISTNDKPQSCTKCPGSKLVRILQPWLPSRTCLPTHAFHVRQNFSLLSGWSFDFFLSDSVKQQCTPRRTDPPHSTFETFDQRHQEFPFLYRAFLISYVPRFIYLPNDTLIIMSPSPKL